MKDQEFDDDDNDAKALIKLVAPNRGHPHALAKMFGGVCRDHGVIHKP